MYTRVREKNNAFQIALEVHYFSSERFICYLLLLCNHK